MTNTIDEEIRHNMALAFFASAYAELMEESGTPLHGEIMDQLPPEIDSAALHAADTLASDVLRANNVGTLCALMEAIERIQEESDTHGDRELTPEMLGHYLAMQAMGHGVGLGDAFGSPIYEAIRVPYVEFSSCSLQNDYVTA